MANVVRREILRNGTAIYRDVFFDAQSTITESVMEASVLDLDIYSNRPLDIKAGDYVIVDSVPYFFQHSPSVSMRNSKDFHYSATLKDSVCFLEKAMFFMLDISGNDAVQKSSEFSLTATIDEFCGLIVRNVNRINSNITFQGDSSYSGTQTFNLTFQNTDCKSALNDICDKCGIEWRMDGNVLKVATKFEDNSGVALSYPINLLSSFDLNRQTTDESCDRLWVFGGNRNLPKNYNDGKTDRLLMVGKTEFLQRGDAFTTEKVKLFDDVYPRRNSSVDKVTIDANGIYSVTDARMDFDLNEYLSTNSAKIAFTSGKAVGYEFEITAYDKVGKTFTIKQQNDNGMAIPNEVVCPSVGDTYVLLDIFMPNSYVANAEQELYEKAMAYFNEECGAKESANVNVSSIWAKKNNVTFKPFQIVTLKNDDLDVDRRIRIVKVKKYPFDAVSFGKRQELTLSDYVPKSSLKVIKGQISEVRKQVFNQFNTIKNNVTNNNTTINQGGGYWWEYSDFE